MTSSENQKNILPFLENEERFRELSAFFVDKSVSELFESSEDTQMRPLIRTGMELLVEKCHQVIFVLSGSPIESVFVRSVMLSFLKNGFPLVFMPAFRNTHVEIGEYRDRLKQLDRFTEWYKRKYGSTMISSEYMDQQVASGKMPRDERKTIEELILLYHYLPFRDAWHVSLQPQFPNLLGTRGIRPDMLFWKPSLLDSHLLVECDGYAFHRYKNSFDSDRKRDRALKALGYDVFRFSGRQINMDPVACGHEIFEFLDDWSGQKEV